MTTSPTLAAAVSAKALVPAYMRSDRKRFRIIVIIN